MKRQERHRLLVPPCRLAFALRNSLLSELLSTENATNLRAICILPPVYTLQLYVFTFHSLALTSRCVIYRTEYAALRRISSWSGIQLHR